MNIDWNAFKSWVFSDAGAGWVFGALTIITTVTITLIRRKRPNIIVCKEVDKFTLIKINRKVKENTLIKYKNSEIKDLAQIDLEFFNNGAETIKNLEIKISLPENTKILDVITNKTSDVVGKKIIGDNSIDINLAYLNSYNDHKSKASMSIVCDGDIRNIDVHGGGAGWSLKHKKLLSKEQVKRRVILVAFLLIVELVIYYLIRGRFFDFNFGDLFFYFIFFVTYMCGFLWAIARNSQMIREILYMRIF